MQLTEFECLWKAKMNPPKPQPPQPTTTSTAPLPPAITLREFFEQMASSERATNYAQDESLPVGTGEELYAYLQANVTATSMRQVVEATAGYDAFRTLVLRKLGLPLSSIAGATIIANILNQYPEMTAAEVDRLTLEEVATLWNGNGVPAGAKPRAKTNKRGRRAINLKQDRQIWDAWQTGTYLDYAALAQTLGIKKQEVESAMDRQRKREKKRPTEKPVKSE